MAHHEKEWILSWLNDAYAMENNLIQVLENHAKDAKDHPQVQQRIQQHLETTRRHADLVKGRIQALGGDVSSIKSGMGSLSGMLQGISTGMAKDELVKNALSDYAAENFEIASYTSLIAAAQAAGDMETVRVCQEILRDEQEMARWLEQQIPNVTTMFLSQQARERGA